MEFSFNDLLDAVQQDPNSPLMEELLRRLCDHGMNYAAKKYGRRLPYDLVYDWVIQGYIDGKFDGAPHRIISHVRHCVDTWATRPTKRPEVSITQIVIEDDTDMDRFELVELMRDILDEALSDEEREIIEARYHDNLTLREIAQLRGTTFEQVRKVETKVIHRLRHPHYIGRLIAFVRG